jgi:hypothetical protein
MDESTLPVNQSGLW